MEPTDGGRGRDLGGQRRSPLDIIINQIRRKRPTSDRKSLGRFLSWSSERGGALEGEAPDEGRGKTGVCVQPTSGGPVCLFLSRFGRNADRRSLNLKYCDLTTSDLLELGVLLKLLPLLEEADLSWNDLIGGSLRALTSHLQFVGGVKTLRFCSCRLNADDITALAESLVHLPVLEGVSLSWNVGVGGVALQGLLGKLRPPLRELHLVACGLTAEDAKALGGVLSSLSSLSLLDVSSNPRLALGEGFRVFGASLAHAASLTVLRLQGCGLSSAHLDHLGAWLRLLPALTNLDLSGNRKLGGGVACLTRLPLSLPHLESLDLHRCSLTSHDLESLMKALPSLTALSQLDVSSNKEVGGVVYPLVSVLNASQMKRLPLNNTSLNLESYTALALLVPFLVSLDVSWSKVVGGRLSLLLDALQPSVVQELRLCSCDLTTEDLRHLGVVGGRGFLSSLRLLDLSYNGLVEDSGWACLFLAGGLGAVEDVDISLRPSDSAPSAGWLPALSHALPAMPALRRLAAQRWSSTPQDRKLLLHRLRTTGVQLQWDVEDTPTLGRDTPTLGRDTPTLGRDTPIAERDTPIAERDTPIAERDTPTAERDTPTTGRDTPTTGRDTPTTGRDTPIAERDTPIAERDTPIAERDTATTGRDTPTTGRDTPTVGRGGPEK